MKIVQCVFKKCGENVDTPAQPYAPLANFTGDLDSEANFCWSSDDNRLTRAKVFEVVEVCLPDWMTIEEFIEHSTKWGFAWNRGLDHELPEAFQRKLVELSGPLQVACCKLLAVKKFRSEFRKSLRAQLENWLVGNSQYANPFSPAQRDSLVKPYDSHEAKCADNRAYWTKCHYRGIPFVRQEKAEACPSQ